MVVPPSDTLAGNEAAGEIADQIASISEDGTADVRIGPETVALLSEDVLIVKMAQAVRAQAVRATLKCVT